MRGNEPSYGSPPVTHATAPGWLTRTSAQVPRFCQPTQGLHGLLNRVWLTPRRRIRISMTNSNCATHAPSPSRTRLRRRGTTAAENAGRAHSRLRHSRLGALGQFGVDDVWVFLPLVLFYPHLCARVSLLSGTLMGKRACLPS
jgi:hypothetical protein